MNNTITNMPQQSKYKNIMLINNYQKLVMLIAIVIASTLGGCNSSNLKRDSKTVEHGNYGENQYSNSLEEAIKEAKQRGFVKCGTLSSGIAVKNKCITFNEQFTNIAVQSILIQQHTGSLICCRTKISGNQIEEQCLDATPWEVELNHECPGEWWKK